MRTALAATVALLGFGWLEQSARAQPSYLPQRAGEVRGVGCYWYRQRRYCNRFCWVEVDGYRFCHRRLQGAGSQAPPSADAYPLSDPDARYGGRHWHRSHP